jgi:ParB-like chromosome segregation protein Spo0J
MTSIESRAAVASPTRPWPADRVELWPIETLIPYANNPRLHSAADIERIAASILTWGWTNPVLVDEQGVLIAGHGRVAAAARLGLRSIPVIIARGWSEEEKQAYRLADNELAARGSWDPDSDGRGSALRPLRQRMPSASRCTGENPQAFIAKFAT